MNTVSAAAACFSSSLSSTSSRGDFQVFLSFRGGDTRKGFTGHLYQALVTKGVRTFIDDEGLERGERIGDSLWRAIERASLCIPVMSRCFADSAWCLMELTKIVSCNKKMIPIFYDVDPDDVRLQTGPYEAAFQSHERIFEAEMVMQWRKALEEVSETAGYDLKNVDDGHEAKLIQLIVKRVLNELNTPPLDVVEHLTGIDLRISSVMRMIDLENKDVKMIGIHGMGGIGKTTLSRVIYNHIYNTFDSSIFLPNIKDSCTRHEGLICLQEKILCEILKNKNIKISDISQGISMMKERFHGKRILIVLDDVDSDEQLKALVGKRDWFGPGSRVIITTRDEHVLNVHKVNEKEIYRPRELSHDESLQLFCCYAFGRDQPIEEYKELSHRVVSMTGGLPLALEVFGSYLFDKKSPKEWQDLLDKLKRIPFNNLLQRLKISYDSLDEEEKRVFLDIACFFIGMDKDVAVDVWQASGLSASLAIKILMHKSLIRIDEGNKLDMHDQIRDMGRGIIREKFPLEPAMHSRLWINEEVIDLLENNKSSRSIEGIEIVNSKKSISTKSFSRVPNLRLLRANLTNIEGEFRNMPTELRWLEWRGCPLKYLPRDFDLRKVAALDLSFSKLVRIRRDPWWSQEKICGFDALKVLDLTCCRHLKATPDFSTTPMLEKLILRYCKALGRLHNSIGLLTRLVLLDLTECTNLKKLPQTLCQVSSLEVLNLFRCANLSALPNQLGGLVSLKELTLSGSKIKRLPDSVGLLLNLHCLLMSWCEDLQELPDSIGSLTKLELLDLSHCESLTTLPVSIGNLENLVELGLSWTGIEVLPQSIVRLQNLKDLAMWCCINLRALPDDIGSMAKLERLGLDGCKPIVSLPVSIANLKNLTELYINETGIEKIPKVIEALETLKVLGIREAMPVTSVPPNIMRNLKQLFVGERGVLAVEEEVEEDY